MKYKGILKENGIVINNDELLDYAMLKCGFIMSESKVTKEIKELRKEFIEWFYSGNFIEIKEEL